MQFRFGGSDGKSYLGCGALLVLLGLALLSPLVDWLVTGLGFFTIGLGLVLVTAGVIYWLTGYRRR